MPEKAGHAPSKKRRMLFSSFRFRAGTHPCPQGSFFYCAAPPPYDGFPATQACGFMTRTNIIHDFLPFETPDFCPIRAHFFPFCSNFLLLLYAIWPAFSLDRKGESVYNRYDRLKSLPAFRRSRQAVFGYSGGSQRFFLCRRLPLLHIALPARPAGESVFELCVRLRAGSTRYQKISFAVRKKRPFFRAVFQLINLRT